MNKVFSLALIGLFALTNIGCNKECDEWQEGDDCVEMREKFFGDYVGVYTQNGVPSNGGIVLSTHSGGINKLMATSQTFELTGSTTFDIPLQNVYDPQGTYTMEGSGSLNGNQLILNYVASAGGQNVITNFTGTK